MTVLLNTTFTGSNGSLWPSPWATALFGGSSGGAIDIQSNRGRMQARNGAYTEARAEPSGISGSSYLLEFTVRFPSINEQYLRIWARTAGWSAATPSLKPNSYFLAMYTGLPNYDSFAIAKVGADFSTNVWLAQNNSFGRYLANTDYNVKFELNSSTIRAKFWQVGQSEPVWQLSVIDNAYVSGGVAVSLVSGDTGQSREVQLDNFSVTSLLASEDPIVISSDWTNYITRSTVGSPEQPNNRQFFTYNGTELVPVDMYIGGP